MKVDDEPFPSQNTVDAKILKRKTKVLTSAKARESGAIDPEMQITAREYEEIKRCREKHKSRFEQGLSTRTAALRPHITSRILLNKW